MKLGICGTGLIVNEGALPALKNVPEIKKSAIFARPHSKEKAEKLARENSIEKVYTDYDELLKDDEINFVYIGLINSVHYEYMKKALAAGKNIIVEKPFATTAAEVEEIKNLAEEKNLYVFEADRRKNFRTWKNLCGHGKLFSIFQPLRQIFAGRSCSRV